MSRTEMLCKRFMSLVIALYGLLIHAATPQVKNVKAFQQYPWGKVYISYEVVGDIVANAGSGKTPFLFVTAKDKTTGRMYEATNLSGDISTATGIHRIVWDASVQGVTINSANVVFTVAYCDELYMVVDLSSGSNSTYYPIDYIYTVPSGGWTDAYKSSKLVLRRIVPGAFNMCGEYTVMLTKPYYIGIFEVTQDQYDRVNTASSGDKRPTRELSWNTIRGDSSIYNWPTNRNVDTDSFVGRLQSRTGRIFDLPTEAQWEFACRAGTTSKYNNGGNYENDLKNIGRYNGNQSDGKGGYSERTTVGSYQPNAWGLYDMHGNVWEWCLDWKGGLTSGITDPIGAFLNNGPWECRVLRGGAWNENADGCTSGTRGAREPGSTLTPQRNVIGFRIVCRYEL